LGGVGGSKTPKFRVWVKNRKLRISQAGFLLDGGVKTGGGRGRPGSRGGLGVTIRKQRKMTIFKVFRVFRSKLTIFNDFSGLIGFFDGLKFSYQSHVIIIWE